MTPEQLLHAGERVDELWHGGMRIIQDPSGPCFAVDAVLLADFARVRAGEHVFDLGTGSGVLPLLLLAKQPQLSITGVELLPEMAERAERNMLLNNVSEQVTIIRGDISRAPHFCGRSVAEVVISNPPYYKEGAGRLNEQPAFAAARSEKYCPLGVLLDTAASLLRPLGRLYLVHRAARLGELAYELQQRNLRLSTLRLVQPAPESPANLLLLEAVKNGRSDTMALPPLVVYAEPGKYSAEMEKIYAGNTISGRHADR